MKRLLTIATLASICGTLAPAAEVYFDTVSTAKASRLHGSYVSAYAGGNRISDVVTGKSLRGSRLDGTSGWNAGVRFGYSFDTPLPIRPALELELGYFKNDLSLIENSESHYKGSLQSLFAFGNVLLALDLENTNVSDFWGRLKPYIGAGTGLAYARVQHLDYVKNGRRVDNEDGGQVSFGYQVFGGLEYELTDQLSIYGEYKYLSLYDLGGGDVQGADLSQYLIGMKFQY